MNTLNINDIKKHADVIASCGTKVGTVDHLEGENQLKLTKDEKIFTCKTFFLKSNEQSTHQIKMASLFFKIGR